MARLNIAIDPTGASAGARVVKTSLQEVGREAQAVETATARLSDAAGRNFQHIATAANSAQQAIGGIAERINRAAGVGQGMRRNAADIEAYGRSLDELRAKFNPVFAASKAYEETLNDLGQAHRVGALSTQEYDAALADLNQRYQMVAVGAEVAEGAMLGAARTSRLAAHNARNLNFQLIDIAQGIPLAFQSPIFALQNFGFQIAQIGQIYMGQGGMRQALRDITGMAASAGSAMLGFAAANPIAAGAIAGVTVAGGALVSMLFSAGEEAETTEDRLDALGSALDRYAASTRLATSDTEAIIEAYGEATSAVRRLIDSQSELAQSTALREAATTIQTLTEQFASLQVQDSPMLAGFGSTEGVIALQEQLGITRKEAESLQEAMLDARVATTLAEHAAAIDRIRVLLDQQRDAHGKLLPEAEALLGPLNEADDAIRRARASAGDLDGALGGATGSASGLADELARAADEAGRAARGILEAAKSDLARARIRMETVGDPVSRAARETGLRFQEEVGSTANLPDALRDQVNLQQAQSEDFARQAAQLDEQTRALEAAQRRTTSGRTRSGSGAKALSEEARAAEQAARAFDRLGESIADKIERSRDEIGMLGLEGQARDEAVAVLEMERLRRDALAEAQKAGANVSQAEVDSINAQIDALGQLELARIRQEAVIESVREAERAAQEEAERTRQFWRDTSSSFVSDWRQGIDQGKSMWEAWADAATAAADRITDKLLNELLDAIFQVNDAANGSGGGGGILGGLLGALGIGGSSAFSAGSSASFASSSDPATWASFFAAANGAVMHRGNVIPFANGGVVDSPTLFPMANGAGLMGEAGPEAIIPLKRGADGRLGVDGGGRGGSRSVSVVIEGSTIVTRGGGRDDDELRRELDQRDRRLREDVFQQVQRAWVDTPDAFPGS